MDYKSIESDITNLQAIRNIIIDLIHEFHKLGKSCVEAYENCIIQSLREPAAIIKKKHLYIKNNLKNLRESIKKIDESLEDTLSELEKDRLAKDIKSLVKDIDSELFKDDAAKILSNDDLEYNSKINKLLDDKGLLEISNTIYAEIEEKIIRANISSQTSSKNKRKYLR